MLASPFLGKKERPTEEELASELGSAKEIWDRFITNLGKRGVINIQEWKSYSPEVGWWSLQLKRKDRTILYLIPERRRFHVAFVLQDKAVQVARSRGLSQRVMRIIEEPALYANGTTCVIDVEKSTDLAPVMKLTSIKLEN